MSHPRFEVKKGLIPIRRRYFWHLRAANGEIVAASELYNSKQACLDGIDSVRVSAGTAFLVDLTRED